MSDASETPSGGSTSTGLAPNVAAAIAYVLGPITGIAFLVLEKHDRFVRFHAMQATIVGFAWIIVSMVLSPLMGIPLLGWFFGLVASLWGYVGLIAALFMMWQAFQQKTWEFPVLGAFARQQAGGV